MFPCDQDDIYIWHKDKLKVMEDIMINNSQIKVLTTSVTNLSDI